MKKIATIIVTYNAEKWLDRCLKSVFESTCHSDVFIVDNASTDTTLDIIKKFPVSLEKLDHNHGFGFANNVALKKLKNTDYDFFFLINQDIYLEEKTLESLLDFAVHHPEIGIIAPIQYDGEGKSIDVNFNQYMALSEERTDYYDTKFCNAAAWLINKNCFDKVGFFNPIFPHYGEDRNYCDRTKYHDLGIAIIKNTKVLHDRNQKMTKEKAIKLAKIKLLTIFVDPNKSQLESVFYGFINALGISKYLFKKHKTYVAIFILMKEYLVLLAKSKNLQKEKLLQL